MGVAASNGAASGGRGSVQMTQPQQWAAGQSVPKDPQERTRCGQYLEEHAADEVTLYALAQVAGLSAFHLCRVFRDAVGMTPHAYQTPVRVRRAKLLLREGLPVTQVAVETGFYDQAHPALQAHRGLPPARYVKEVTT